MDRGRIVGALAVGMALSAAAPAVASAEPSVAAFRAASPVPSGERVVVSGRVAPPVAAVVSIETAAGAGWRAVATLRADRRGRFRAALPLRASAQLRARVRAPDGTLGTPSRRRAVTIRRRAELVLLTDETERIAGRPLAVRGRVRPARPGEAVAIVGRRGSRRFVLTRARVRPGGAVRATVRLPTGGRWRLELEAPGRPGVDADGVGRTPAFEAHGRNPHGIPRSAAHYIVQHLGGTRLYYYENGMLRRVLPVVFGKPSTPTPVGSFRVYSKTPGPGPAFGPLAIWYHGNYGIHGTNQEYLLRRSYRYYSHGCTRNFNDNIRWLYPRVPIGTPVRNIP